LSVRNQPGGSDVILGIEEEVLRLRRSLALLALAGLLLAAVPAPARAAAPSGPPRVPAGFQVAPAIQNVHHPSRLAFGPDGRLYIAQQTGEILAVTVERGQEAARQQVAAATKEKNLLGIALKDDRLWASETGIIALYTRQADGTYGDRQEILTGIPFGLHQNDGFAFGPDGKLYLGVGSTTDRGPESHAWSGTVLRMNPDGSGAEVFAKGFRNPYGIGFDPAGNLWVADNGSDNPSSPDELNLVVQGADYGFPRVFGMPPAGSGTRAPVALFGEHNSTNGIAFYTSDRFPNPYQGGLFAAMWGSSFDDDVGRSVGFVRLTHAADGWKAAVESFATGFTRPLDVAVGPEGDLWVADFYAETVYRIWYTGPGTGPQPTPPPAPTPPPPPAPTPPPPPAPAPPPALAPALPAWIWPAGAGVLLLAAGALLLNRRGR
jgi:glucose/arabinose dehydrogenase